MTASRSTQIKRRVRLWERRLGLKDWGWKIEVRVVVPEDGHRATAEASPSYREAVLEFDPARVPTDSDGLDDWCVHELLHCVTWPLAYIAELYAGEDEAKIEIADNEHERVTTDFEKIAMRLWRATKKPKAKRKHESRRGSAGIAAGARRAAR